MEALKNFWDALKKLGMDGSPSKATIFFLAFFYKELEINV